MDHENAKRIGKQLCQREKGLRLRVRNVPCSQQNPSKPLAATSRHVTDHQQQNKQGCDESRVQPKAEIAGAARRSGKRTISKANASISSARAVFHAPCRPQLIADVDWNDRGDPQLCAEYVTDIYHHLHDEERKPYYSVKPEFLGEQLSIGTHHRSVLVDWLVQVSEKLQLCNVTLHVMVDLIDRYLQVQQVSKQRLQLVGVTSMLLACKYEETRCPSVHDMTYITDDAYTTGEIRSMEMDILRGVDYRMSKPVPLEFLRRYSKVAQAIAIEHHLAKYFLELALLDEALSPVHPSKKAASALLLARTVHLCLDPAKVWSPKLAHFSGYQLGNLMGIVDALKGVVRNWHGHPKLTAVRSKYSVDALGRVSSLPALRYL